MSPNTPRPTSSGSRTTRPTAKTPTRPAIAQGRGRGALYAWLGIGLVIVLIVVLVLVKVTASPTPVNTSATPTTPAPVAVAKAVTSVPLSVFNTIGVSDTSVTKPTIITGQPPMTLDGKSPAMLAVGGDYCPFCAAQRWPVTIALSRFGTWSNLQLTASSGVDTYPLTPTFSFYGADYTSPYIHFNGVEQYTNIPLADGSGYTTLQKLTAAQAAIATKYSSPTYIPGAATPAPGAPHVAFPFIDINNQALLSGASYSPQLLAGATQAQIAAGLTDTTSPITQAIITSANYISASICAATHGQPGLVCNSSGVKAASQALNLG